jgi:superfamily I DNA/RNA helicase
MPRFIFRLPSQDEIKNSRSGRTMLHIIETDYPVRFTIVTGCPGSGKTTVSILRLIRLINSGTPCLLLTFQRMLKVAIENLLITQGVTRPRDKVNTIYTWFTSKTDGKYLNDFGNPQNRLTAKEIEDALIGKGFDKVELIIDEGQDLEERIYQSFPKIFRRLTVGADDDQQARGGVGASERIIRTHLQISLNDFELQFNYRNSFQIYDFARHFVPLSPKANDVQTLDELKRHRGTGDKPEVLKFDTQQQMRDRLKTIINDNKAGYNIGILFPGKEQVESYYQLVHQMTDGDCSKYYSDMPREEREATENDLKNVLVTTFISAKGMEFDIVLMPEFQSTINTPEERKKYYVGCTRAKSRLIIMYVGNIPAVLTSFPTATYDTGSLF